MARRSEQGNVLGFVLVGALLVALLLGGIYVARNSMGQLATNNGSSVPSATDGVSDKDTEPEIIYARFGGLGTLYQRYIACYG